MGRRTGCFAWPSHVPYPMPCCFSLWMFIKYHVLLLPIDLPDVRNGIKAVVIGITIDTLIKVCEELAYRLDVCCVTNGIHIVIIR